MLTVKVAVGQITSVSNCFERPLESLTAGARPRPRGPSRRTPQQNRVRAPRCPAHPDIWRRHIDKNRRPASSAAACRATVRTTQFFSRSFAFVRITAVALAGMASARSAARARSAVRQHRHRHPGRHQSSSSPPRKRLKSIQIGRHCNSWPRRVQALPLFI